MKWPRNWGNSDSINDVPHVPVLLNEVLEYLDPKPGENFVDGTFGDGGHGKVIAEKVLPDGKVLGIDWDPKQIAKHTQVPFTNIIVVENNYANIERIVREHNFHPVDGVLLDLGFSVFHIEGAGKGFSFQKDEPLLMKYNPGNPGPTAEEIVNEWSEEELERLFREYGEEMFASRIAHGIVRSRRVGRIKTSVVLAQVISGALPAKFRASRLHPATRVFQALRIAVNDEYGNVRKGIEGAVNVLRPGGRIAVITFHSGEDRIVKELFREYEGKGAIELLNKKVVPATREEILKNPRSRSAKLRAARKL